MKVTAQILIRSRKVSICSILKEWAEEQEMVDWWFQCVSFVDHYRHSSVEFCHTSSVVPHSLILWGWPVSAWSRWAVPADLWPERPIATCNHLHLQRGNMIRPLRCLSYPLSWQLSNNGCMCQNSERGMADGLELSASNCCFVFLLRGVKIEMEKEEEKKNMQALSAHCRGT